MASDQGNGCIGTLNPLMQGCHRIEQLIGGQITAGDLGLNPQNDGRMIRLNVPALSTEVRKKMVSRIKELSEDSKISIRNIRRDANKAADNAEKAKEMSEDDRDKIKEEIQELTKKYEAQATEMAKAREAEVTDS